MNNFILIALLPLLCPLKSTTESSKISAEGATAQEAIAASTNKSLEPVLSKASTVQEADAASTNKSIEPASSKAHPLMAGPPSNVTRYGGTKKIEFFNPLKQIKQGKIKYTYQYYGDEALARAFKKDYSDERFGWDAWSGPHMLWCLFDEWKVPAGITFLPSQLHAHSNRYQVTKWQFVASKDSMCNQRSTWDVICEDLSGTGFSSRRVVKGCFAGKEVQEKYRCIGIRVLEGDWDLGNYYGDDEFIITNINMYEKVAGYN